MAASGGGPTPRKDVSGARRSSHERHEVKAAPAKRRRIPISRRAAIMGTAATGLVAGVALTFASCHRPQETSDGDPQVVEGSSATSITDKFEQADLGLSAASSWEVPLGTVLFEGPGTWLPALATGDTASHMVKGCAFSTASGTMVDVVAATKQTGSNWVVYNARCSDEVYAWVELNMLDRSWVLYAGNFAEGKLSGTPTKLMEGDADYEPPELSCTDDTVIWLNMPSSSGKKTAESSYCYLWHTGDKSAQAVVESQGRFGCAPSVSGGNLILCPRVNVESGVYYGITAYDLSDDAKSQIDRLILPQTIKPFYATRIGDNFVFSIEATYSSGGLFANMGTYIGSSDGPYTYLSREPAARVCGTEKGRYAIKSGASYFVVDTESSTYDIVAASNRCLDYGEYPAADGTSANLVTFSTIKDADTGYPSTVNVRSFAL